MRILIALLLLTASGIGQALVSPPYGLVPLHLVCWIPALTVLERLRGWKALLAGWFCGIASNAAIFPWLIETVQEFSNLPPLGGVGVKPHGAG